MPCRGEGGFIVHTRLSPHSQLTTPVGAASADRSGFPLAKPNTLPTNTYAFCFLRDAEPVGQAWTKMRLSTEPYCDQKPALL